MPRQTSTGRCGQGANPLIQVGEANRTIPTVLPVMSGVHMTGISTTPSPATKGHPLALTSQNPPPEGNGVMATVGEVSPTHDPRFGASPKA